MSPCSTPSYGESHDGHQERIWEQPGPSTAADVVLVSDEYQPDSVGWRMEQQEIQGPRKSQFRVKRPAERVSRLR
jgi:hypothetical protein